MTLIFSMVFKHMTQQNKNDPYIYKFFLAHCRQKVQKGVTEGRQAKSKRYGRSCRCS